MEKSIIRESKFDHDNLFIKTNQLTYEGKNLFESIQPSCTVCDENGQYQILITKVQGVAGFATSGVVLKYKVKCSNCNNTYEIEEEDYELLRPIVKLNDKLNQGKIDADNFYSRVEKKLMKIDKIKSRK